MSKEDLIDYLEKWTDEIDEQFDDRFGDREVYLAESNMLDHILGKVKELV